MIEACIIGNGRRTQGLEDCSVEIRKCSSGLEECNPGKGYNNLGIMDYQVGNRACILEIGEFAWDRVRLNFGYQCTLVIRKRI